MNQLTPSSATPLPPFRLEPEFVNRVWGYTDLRPWYDRMAPGTPIGEVWLTGDSCLAATGPFAGEPLDSIFRAAPESMLGPQAPAPDSPLLIKMLFAREKLSVQVHPDDALARKYGQPRGKTECWYALAAEPGAEVACGLLPGVTLDQVRAGIADGTLERSLNMIPIAAGDMIYVDAGTVHAIWPGSILLETQQNCDITYRMYDYGRGRELHIDKGLEATRLVTGAGKTPARPLEDRTVLVDEKYFRMERFPQAGSRTSESLVRPDEPAPRLAYLFAAGGSGRITGSAFEPVDLPPYSVVAVPALVLPFVIEDLGGLELIRITPRWP